MKKVVSLLMTLAIICVLGSGAFAAEDIATMPGASNETPTGGGIESIGGGTALPRSIVGDTNDEGTITFDNGEDTIMFENYSDYAYDESGIYGINPMSALGLVGENAVTIKEGEMFLVSDKKVLLPEMRLEPGTEYTFDVYYAVTDLDAYDIRTVLTEADALPVTKGILGNATLRVRPTKGGSAIASTDLKTSGIGAAAVHRVDIETKDTYNTKHTDVIYSITYSGTLPITEPATEPDVVLHKSEIAFVVGHGKMTEEDIEGYEEGDEVEISNDAPIIESKLIDRLVKNFGYKAVTLIAEDDSWEYRGRMSGMADTNFYYTQDVIPSIMNKLDQDFKFLLFPAGVTFPTNGEMRIDVSDVSDTWDRIFTYLYRNGTLTRVNTTYDGAADQVVFRTNYLGAFVMTDVEITDTTIIEQPGQESAAPETSEPETNVPNPNNPNTGMPVGLNLIVGLGAISLLTAGTTIIRKKK